MATAGPLLKALLARYELEGLLDWANEMAMTGAAEEEIILQLYEQEPLHQAYPWIRQRESAGLTPMTIEEGLAYYNEMSQAAKLYGLTLTRDEMNKLIAADVSINEAVEERIAPVASLIHMLPAGVRAQVNTLYGITTEDLQRAWMDPKESAQTLRRRLTAAQIANESMVSGFAQLNAAQAERLVAGGFTGEDVRDPFGRLVQQRELLEQVEGYEEDIGTDAVISGMLGDQGVITELERRSQRRAAQFQGGGGFSTSERGIVGLGTATR